MDGANDFSFDEWAWSSPSRVIPSIRDLRTMTRKDRDRFFDLILSEGPLRDRLIAMEHRMDSCLSFDPLEIYVAQHTHLAMFLRDHRLERASLLSKYGISHFYSE